MVKIADQQFDARTVDHDLDVPAAVLGVVSLLAEALLSVAVASCVAAVLTTRGGPVIESGRTHAGGARGCSCGRRAPRHVRGFGHRVSGSREIRPDWTAPNARDTTARQRVWCSEHTAFPSILLPVTRFVTWYHQDAFDQIIIQYIPRQHCSQRPSTQMIGYLPYIFAKQVSTFFHPISGCISVFRLQTKTYGLI